MKNTKKSNVYDFAKHLPKDRAIVPIPKNCTAVDYLASFDIETNQFGFSAGDTLICQKNFDKSKLSKNSLVIDDIGDDQIVTIYANAKNPVAVVKAVMREVAQ